jgi:hypothetical protein
MTKLICYKLAVESGPYTVNKLQNELLRMGYSSMVDKYLDSGVRVLSIKIPDMLSSDTILNLGASLGILEKESNGLTVRDYKY